MFIHIGNDTVIQSKDVVTIIDRNVITSSSIMENMMDNARKKEKVVGDAADTKSVVVTSDLIYFSSLSVSTLKKRASMIATISKLDDYSEDIE